MKNKFFYGVSTFFVIASFFYGTAVAQKTVDINKQIPTPSNREAATLVATVDIQDTIVTSDKKNEFTISFLIANKELMQTGVRYGVRLLSEKSTEILDEKLADEVLILQPQSKFQKEITYTPPTTLTGTYTLALFAINQQGFPVGFAPVKSISLLATGKGVIVDTASCRTSFEGSGEKNAPLYGVTVRPAERFILTCSITNTTDETISAVPVFDTYRDGDIITPVAPGVAGTVVSLSPGFTKQVDVVVPTLQKSGMYNVVASFTNASLASNKVPFRYFVKGAFATVKNVSLDKDVYQKGETAKALFVWIPAGVRPEKTLEEAKKYLPEMTLRTELINGKGKKCAAPITQALSHYTSKSVIPIDVRITRDCVDPTVVVTIKDTSGALLAKETFAGKTTSITFEEKSSYKDIGVLLAGIFVLIMVYLYKKKRAIQIVAGILLPLSFIAMPLDAHAATFWGNPGSMYVQTNLNKSTYLPGETIYITASVTSYESNPYYVALDAVTTNSSPVSLIYQVIQPGGLIGVTKSLIAPTTVASYNVTYNFDTVYGYLTTQCSSFGGSGCYSSFYNQTNQSYYSLSTNGGQVTVGAPPGLYEWLGGDVYNRNTACPVPSDPVANIPEVGTTQFLSGGDAFYTETGCY